MADLYNDAVSALLNDGWSKVNPASFTKGNFEIVFDTSHYVEIYVSDSRRCLYESTLDTTEDFNQFLTKIRTELDAT